MIRRRGGGRLPHPKDDILKHNTCVEFRILNHYFVSGGGAIAKKRLAYPSCRHRFHLLLITKQSLLAVGTSTCKDFLDRNNKRSCEYKSLKNAKIGYTKKTKR